MIICFLLDNFVVCIATSTKRTSILRNDSENVNWIGNDAESSISSKDNAFDMARTRTHDEVPLDMRVEMPFDVAAVISSGRLHGDIYFQICHLQSKRTVV